MDQSWSFQYTKPPQPEGPLGELSESEAERILLERVNADNADKADALWQLARSYARVKRRDKAMECLRQVLDLKSDLESKAGCILAMGQAAEQVEDYEGAIRFYKEALSLEPCSTATWYFIHNNLGFSLNILGQFSEGEAYCRRAIAIDSSRPNAFKNLGIALEGQDRRNEAAQCYVTATRVNASDPRALALLEALLSKHPELHVDFRTELEVCRKAVEFAANQTGKHQPVVLRGWRKHLVLLQARCRRVVGRLLGRKG